jgi:hypothetical protein
MVWTFCGITGLLLTMIGTVLAAAALLQDWRDHAGGEPLVPVLARARQRLARSVRSLLGKTPSAHVVGAHAALQANATMTASGYVAPPSNAPVDVQMRFVRERLLALEARIAKERGELNQKIDQVQQDGQAAEARSRNAIADVEAKVREVATGSVRMELVGLVLVGIGSIAGALPTVFGW